MSRTRLVVQEDVCRDCTRQGTCLQNTGCPTEWYCIRCWIQRLNAQRDECDVCGKFVSGSARALGWGDARGCQKCCAIFKQGLRPEQCRREYKMALAEQNRLFGAAKKAVAAAAATVAMAPEATEGGETGADGSDAPAPKRPKCETHHLTPAPKRQKCDQFTPAPLPPPGSCLTAILL